MAENSAIEWTDHTWNPWRGCAWATLADGTQHPGCDHCYAAAMAKRNPQSLGVWGANGTRVVAVDKTFMAPLKWNNQAKKEGKRKRVFVDSMHDFFDDWPGQMNDSKTRALYSCDVCGRWDHTHQGQDGFWEHGMNDHGAEVFLCDGCGSVGTVTGLTIQDVRNRAFREVIANCDFIDFIIATKRPQNIRRMWPTFVHEVTRDGKKVGELPRTFMHNVWLLTSVSNQQTADEMIPELLKCRALSPVLGISAEPLLGPIDLTHLHYQSITEIDAMNGTHGVRRPHEGECPRLDWVIAGGESGSQARPCHPDWIRSLRDQCQAASVAFFFKQFGEWFPIHGTGRPRPDENEEITPFKWVGLNGEIRDSGCEPYALMLKIGKKAAGAMLDGREWREFPEPCLEKLFKKKETNET